MIYLNPMLEDPLKEYEFSECFRNNDMYHHTHKGCKISMRRDDKFSMTKGKTIEYAYCETHNVYCSKTGWNFHHYLGSDSIRIYNKFKWRPCKVCGRKTFSSINNEDDEIICPTCIDIKSNL